jgi:phosphatidylinositol glycan class W
MTTKEDKERHVTGHSGTTIWEINSILILLMISYLLNKFVWFNTRKCSFWVQLLVEYATLVLPFLISITWTQWMSFIVTVQLGAIFVCMVFGSVDVTKQQAPARKHEAFVVGFRSYLQLITIAAILAVDFHVFPRRFAKTETFGTSLMDIGVGAFIFSSGLVAGPRLGNGSVQQGSIFRTFQLVVPSLVLGFSRAFLTRAVNYQEHVSEYGVHWNFFITLGLLPLLITVQQFFVPRLPPIVVGLFVMLG